MEEPEVGQAWGPYFILDRLARGGFSVIYRAVRLAGPTEPLEVALKVLHEHVQPGLVELANALAEEARIGRKVVGANLLRVHGWGIWQGRGFIEMELFARNVPEFLAARDLRWVIENQPLPLAEALNVAYQVALALAELNDIARSPLDGPRVIHRDVKPENILVGPGFLTGTSGLVKLTDYGLARRLPAMTHVSLMGRVDGTFLYMSPEHVTGPHLRPSADRFSFGLVFFELLTECGAARFLLGENLSVPSWLWLLSQWSKNHVARLAEAVDRSCSGAGEFLARCLAPLPQDRFDSSHEMARHLRRLELDCRESALLGGGRAVVTLEPEQPSGALAPPVGVVEEAKGIALRALKNLVESALADQRAPVVPAHAHMKPEPTIGAATKTMRTWLASRLARYESQPIEAAKKALAIRKDLRKLVFYSDPRYTRELFFVMVNALELGVSPMLVAQTILSAEERG